MGLIDKIEKTIWAEFSSYKNVSNYIKKWHQSDGSSWENFHIYRDNMVINLNETLHDMGSETIIKIAIDLGIETPDFIPAIPIIKNVLKEKYPTAFSAFQKALKQIEESPDLSIGSANSTLESIVKHILENDNVPIKFNSKDTLYALTQSILKEFTLFPNEQIPLEIRQIGNGLLNASKSIEQLRSEKTTFHGKTQKDYIIEDPLYAYFIVNAISTVGLFLISFYEKKYNNINVFDSGDNNLDLASEEGVPF